MASARVWERGHPRTRLVVLNLWDGKCGHCQTPLLTSEECDSIQESPFEVDHIVPTSIGGADAIENYIAACWNCNNSRRAKPITNALTRLRIALVRRFIAAEDFPDYAAKVCEIDRAISYAAYFSMVRCFEHGWHVVESPFYERCYRQCGRKFRGRLPTLWWSRFGLDSSYVRAVVAENLYIRGIVRGRDWWTRPQGWEVMLPRYCSSPSDIARVLDAVSDIGQRPRIDAAPECYFGATHALSDSNQRKALRQSERASAATILSHDDLIECGLRSKRLARLWMRKRWPTDLFPAYRGAFAAIQRPGQLNKHLAALNKLHTTSDLQAYLEKLTLP